MKIPIYNFKFSLSFSLSLDIIIINYLLIIMDSSSYKSYFNQIIIV